MKNEPKFCWFIGSLLVALLAGVASRFYYALVFLPRHHGSWSKALVRLVDFEGWTAYVTSPVGLALHGLVFLSVSTATLSLCGRRAKSFRSTPPRRPPPV
jgi:hypothetical protein